MKREKKDVVICYKSGGSIKCTLNLTVREVVEKVRNKEIDINSETLSLINWGEVEAIIPCEE